MRGSIFINGRFLSQRLTGVQRYALETLLALDELVGEAPTAADFDLAVLAPPGTPPPGLKHIELREVGPLRGHAWEQLCLPWAARNGLLLSFGPTGPILKRDQVVTMHDAAVVAFPAAYSWQFRTFYRLLLPLLARRCAAIISVSEFAKREVVRSFGAPPERTFVSGEGWQHISRFGRDASVLDQHGLRPKRYVLAVGSQSPHKNLQVLARAAEQLQSTDYDVVIAGGADPRIFGQIDRRTFERVKLIGYVSDAELRALYENAGVFVFPSLYEGFGLPPLEAIALGCPVIASNVAAMPEVCGRAAKYFAPHDATALARAIDAVMTSDDERESLARAGAERLSTYSWKATAENHLHVLESVSQTMDARLAGLQT
jgi:glycosyltransferase involved in cell wall biosynthesis